MTSDTAEKEEKSDVLCHSLKFFVRDLSKETILILWERALMAYTRDSVHEAVQIKVTYNFTKESENQSLQSCCDFFQICSFYIPKL